MSGSARPWSATRTGLLVPWLAIAAAGRTQTAYRAYLDHAQYCADCLALNAQCEAAQKLWAAFREARGARP